MNGTQTQVGLEAEAKAPKARVGSGERYKVVSVKLLKKMALQSKLDATSYRNRYLHRFKTTGHYDESLLRMQHYHEGQQVLLQVFIDNLAEYDADYIFG